MLFLERLDCVEPRLDEATSPNLPANACTRPLLGDSERSRGKTSSTGLCALCDSRKVSCDRSSAAPSSDASDVSLLSVVTRADSGSGTSLLGAKTGERAGLSPRVGVARPLRGMEELEKLRL